MLKADKKYASRKEVVDEIIDRSLSADKISEELSEMIQLWLVEDDDAQLKEEALMKIFNEDFCFAIKPSKRLIEALPMLRHKLDMADTPVRMPFYKKTYFKVASVAAVIMIALGIGFSFQKNKMAEPKFSDRITLDDAGPVVAESVTAEPDTVVPGMAESVAAEPDTVASSASGSNAVVSTEVQNPRKIELADGSKIWLGENSTVEYSDDFLENRTITLNGEAYFSVAKFDGKPFIVKADELIIRVLGTEFFVRAGSQMETTEVSLSSGKVEVINQRDDVVYELSPHEQLLLDNITNEVIRNIVDNDYIVQYKIVEPEPTLSPQLTLKDVFVRMANNYNIQFKIEEGVEIDTNIRIDVNNSLPLNELLDIVRTVAAPSFNYSIEGDTVRITKL